MRLTTSDRDAFVRSVMDDVPRIGFDAEARKFAQPFIESQIPPEVLVVWKKFPNMLKCSSVGAPGSLATFYFPGELPYGLLHDTEIWSQLSEMAKKKREQQEQRCELKSKLKGIIQSCSTLKQAKERLPEFVKYLPAERGKTDTSNLPAVANLVADLTNLGWPKGAQA